MTTRTIKRPTTLTRAFFTGLLFLSVALVVLISSGALQPLISKY